MQRSWPVLLCRTENAFASTAQLRRSLVQITLWLWTHPASLYCLCKGHWDLTLILCKSSNHSLLKHLLWDVLIKQLNKSSSLVKGKWRRRVFNLPNLTSACFHIHQTFMDRSISLAQQSASPVIPIFFLSCESNWFITGRKECKHRCRREEVLYSQERNRLLEWDREQISLVY